MRSPRSLSISQVLKLKHELEAKLGGIRDEVRGLAYQVKTLASADDTAVAKPAAVELGGFDDARALRKVVEALEQRMTRKLTQIDERLARGARGAKSGQRSSHPAAAAAAGESGGAGAEHHHRRRSSSSKNLVAATTPASAQGAVSAIAPEDEAMAC